MYVDGNSPSQCEHTKDIFVCTTSLNMIFFGHLNKYPGVYSTLGICTVIKPHDW